MSAIRHRMAEGSPDCAKIRMTFRLFFRSRSCLQTKNLLWRDCHSRFFYKLMALLFAEPLFFKSPLQLKM